MPYKSHGDDEANGPFKATHQQYRVHDKIVSAADVGPRFPPQINLT